jgi:putative glutamine amidotransferase
MSSHTSTSAARRPIVGVLANAVVDGDLPGQSVDDKYLDALIALANVATVIIPARELAVDVYTFLHMIDGLVLTGAASNVHPRRFAVDGDEALHSPFDLGRDASALDLLQGALTRDMPVLAICRGLQELNVSRGGTLAPAIQLDSARFDHGHGLAHAALEQRYGLAHTVDIEAGGVLAQLLGEGSVRVNSLHAQAIARLGRDLRIEGRAPDGTIEALSVPGRRFALGVQWHPEYQAAGSEVSRRIFQAFGAAVRQYQSIRP